MNNLERLLYQIGFILLLKNTFEAGWDDSKIWGFEDSPLSKEQLFIEFLGELEITKAIR